MRLRFHEKTFPFHFKRLLDFSVVREMFVALPYRRVASLDHVATLLDLGGNIGASVVYFKLMHPEAKVWVYEPDPECFEMLRKNIEPFGEDVYALQKAVSSISGRRTFYKNAEHWGNSFFTRAKNEHAIEVDCVSLDEAIRNTGADIDVLKFDIEGAEYEVFKDTKELARVRQMIGEIHPDLVGKTFEDFVSLIPGFNLALHERQGARSLAFFSR